MRLTLFRRSQPAPTADAELHRYREDIAYYAKLRDSALQRYTVQPTTENQLRLQRYDTLIDCAQVAAIRLAERLNKQAGSV